MLSGHTIYCTNISTAPPSNTSQCSKEDDPENVCGVQRKNIRRPIKDISIHATLMLSRLTISKSFHLGRREDGGFYVCVNGGRGITVHLPGIVRHTSGRVHIDLNGKWAERGVGGCGGGGAR